MSSGLEPSADIYFTFDQIAQLHAWGENAISFRLAFTRLNLGLHIDFSSRSSLWTRWQKCPAGLLGSRPRSESYFTWTSTLAGYGAQCQKIYRHVAFSALKHEFANQTKPHDNTTPHTTKKDTNSIFYFQIMCFIFHYKETIHGLRTNVIFKFDVRRVVCIPCTSSSSMSVDLKIQCQSISFPNYLSHQSFRYITLRNFFQFLRRFPLRYWVYSMSFLFSVNVTLHKHTHKAYKQKSLHLFLIWYQITRYSFLFAMKEQKIYVWHCRLIRKDESHVFGLSNSCQCRAVIACVLTEAAAVFVEEITTKPKPTRLESIPWKWKTRTNAFDRLCRSEASWQQDDIMDHFAGVWLTLLDG